jgi:hypothetical protein
MTGVRYTLEMMEATLNIRNEQNSDTAGIYLICEGMTSVEGEARRPRAAGRLDILWTAEQGS